MNRREIVLHLEEQKYEALRRALLEHGTDLCTEMQRRLEACYKELVPAQEREGAGSATREKKLEQTGQAAVFRVVEGGKTECFSTEATLLCAMERLCLYWGKSAQDRPAQFSSLFQNAVSISDQEFTACVIERLGDGGRATGAFDVDLDGARFSLLDASAGWLTFRVQDVAAVVGRQPHNEAEVLAQLQDKQLDTEERCLFLRGPRPLQAEGIDILEYLGDDNGQLVFQADILAGEKDVFGAQITVGDESYAAAYAAYDISAQKVCDTLDIAMMRHDQTVYFLYRLTPETADALKRKLDDYCMALNGRHQEEQPGAAIRERNSPDASKETEHAMGPEMG